MSGLKEGISLWLNPSDIDRTRNIKDKVTQTLHNLAGDIDTFLKIYELQNSIKNK